MNRENNRLEHLVISIDEEMKNFNTYGQRLKYIDAEVDIFKNNLDYQYEKRKMSLRDEIENNVLFETMLEIIKKYYDNTMMVIKEMKSITQDLIKIYDFDMVKDIILDYRRQTEKNNMRIREIENSLFFSRYDRPKNIYVYEVKNWLMTYNSYLNQFIELLSYFDYEDF